VGVSRRFFVSKAAFYISLFILSITTVFLLVRMMPGSPLDYLGGEAEDVPYILTEEVREKLLSYYGLDKPLWEQYIVFVNNLLHLNFGYSIYFSEPVTRILLPHLMRTLILITLGFLFSISISFPLSIISAWRRGSTLDTIITLLSMSIYSIPSFALAILFLIVFSVELKLFPLIGFSAEENILDILWYALGPAMVFAVAESGRAYYFMRNSFISELDKDYILFAKSKGLKNKTIILRHLLRGSLSPIISKLALLFGYSLLSCMFVENVFNYPGITWLLLISYEYYDYPVLESILLIFMFTVIVMNAIADIISFIIDPRVRGGWM